MTTPAAPPTPADPAALIRTRAYRSMLVLAAIVGVLVSFASWCFLELVYWIQHEIYRYLPADLGFDTVPWWWPLPFLAVAGLLVAVAVLKLPGHGGHIPYLGLKGGLTEPLDVPGVLLAALAGLGLGVVLGPEAPLIALGSALGVLAIRRAKKDSPDQVVAVLAAAGAFAALATVFGSPIVGAVILIEAAGLGGPMLPVILLPGLLSAGIGSLLFIGMSSWTGLSTGQYALSPFSLPSYGAPSFADFGWTVLLAAVAAVLTFLVIQLASVSARIVNRRPWVLMPVAGLVIAILAILFAQWTPESTDVVLFSGQDAFTSLLNDPTSLSVSTLSLLLLLKGVAWSVSLGSFRGGPTFPALFLGAVLGLLAARLPGFSETPAVAAMMAAAAVSMLRLPLSCIVIVMFLTVSSGPGTGPIVIVSVVVAYLTTQALIGMVERRQSAQTPQPAAPSANV